MDKELLRVVIIATGLIIIIGMLLWGYFRNQHGSEEEAFLKDQQAEDGEGLFSGIAHTFKSLLARTKKSAYTRDASVKLNPKHKPSVDSGLRALSTAESALKSTSAQDEADDSAEQDAFKQHLPRLIQLSIVAKTEHGFNGADLDNIFNSVGLEYGSVKVYERLDIHRGVDFSVASMVNPGTFPDTDLESFYTPGISFFMQPQTLADPSAVFDDLVLTIDLLATELDGIIWDADRNVLTDYTFNAIRASLR
ncbi:MAG: cell division protein ZipA C-terminal FtsZ-binding domain-containing protein [Methylococcales bacterium]|nr:cell division protein ZipA C-terminal FtsZ-binding domain-containing protein [Methylococcales bacterium]